MFGSHNVVQVGTKKYAVRMDQIKINISKKPENDDIKINDIEFQGEKVKITCIDKNNNEIYVLVDDSFFYKSNFKLAQNVNLNWSKNRAHLLKE